MTAELDRVRDDLGKLAHAADVFELRRLYDQDGARFFEAGDAAQTPVSLESCAAEWLVPAGASRRTIYYLHGGGFMVGSLASHRHLALALARASEGRSFALDYRLAPEHRHPAPLEDAVAGYRHLLAGGIAADQIAIVGDSAGGNLVMTTLLALKREGLALPACAVCLSPWVDYAASGGSMTTKAAVDPVISRDGALGSAQLYLGDADPRTSSAAVLDADLSGLPPLLIQVGSHETLLDDSLRLAGRAAHADVAVTLQAWPNMVHVWPFYFPVLAEGRAAIGDISAFVRRHARG